MAKFPVTEKKKNAWINEDEKWKWGRGKIKDFRSFSLNMYRSNNLDLKILNPKCSKNSKIFEDQHDTGGKFHTAPPLVSQSNAMHYKCYTKLPSDPKEACETQMNSVFSFGSRPQNIYIYLYFKLWNKSKLQNTFSLKDFRKGYATCSTCSWSSVGSIKNSFFPYTTVPMKLGKLRLGWPPLPL